MPGLRATTAIGIVMRVLALLPLLLLLLLPSVVFTATTSTHTSLPSRVSIPKASAACSENHGMDGDARAAFCSHEGRDYIAPLHFNMQVRTQHGMHRTLLICDTKHAATLYISRHAA